MITPQDFEQLMGEHIEDAKKTVRSIGLFKSIAVTERFKGHGIGTILLRQSVEWFDSQKATAIVSLAWESNGIGFAQGILESLGFRRKLHIENFWYTDSLQKGYQCPTGGNPCRCAANISSLTR